MATNYYKNLFNTGYQKPKPQAQATVPGASQVQIPGVTKNVIQNTVAQKSPLTKQNNLTTAGNLFENNITDILSGNKKAPGVDLALQQAIRSNALDTTNSLGQAKQQAAAAGAKPGTVLYNRIIAGANAASQGNALARSGQVAGLQTQGYQDALGKAQSIETDAYGKAAAERAYGDERDDVSYGRQLNERDYGDSRDDKNIDLALKNRDFGAKEALDQFSMKNTLDRQAMDDYNKEKEFDASMSRQEALDDQWERTFGSAEDQRGKDNTFRDTQFGASEDQRSKDNTFRDTTLANSEDQRELDNMFRNTQFGASEDQRAKDNTFRNSQFGEDTRRYDLNRGDTLSRNQTLDDQWNREFGEDTRRFDVNRADTKEQQAITNDQWLKEFGSNEDQRSKDNSFRDTEFGEDTRRFDVTREDEKSRQATLDSQWDKEFGANREDRSQDVAFRDKEFGSAEDQREFENMFRDKEFGSTEDQRSRDNQFRDLERGDTLNQQNIANSQWDREFGSNESQRGIDNQFRDLERQDNLSRQQTLDQQWEKEFGASREDKALDNSRYDTEYADSRSDIAYDRDQEQFEEILKSMGSQRAKDALNQARLTGDFKSAYENLFENGGLKEEYQDMNPEEAKFQSRYDELKQVFPEMSDEAIRAQVQKDMKTDYDLERAGVENEASKALTEKRIKNIQDVQDFDSLTAREISAMSSNPELVNEYKAKGFIIPASTLTAKTTNNNGSVVNGLMGAAVTAEDVAKKGVVVGKTMQMEDGSIVRVTSVKSAPKQGTQVRGTDAKTGKEVVIYDSMKK